MHQQNKYITFIKSLLEEVNGNKNKEVINLYEKTIASTEAIEEISQSKAFYTLPIDNIFFYIFSKIEMSKVSYEESANRMININEVVIIITCKFKLIFVTF